MKNNTPIDSIENDDEHCDLDPEKICDNCMACVIGDSDYSAVTIEGIRLENEPE